MSSLLARIGHIEARISSSSPRWTVPRKRRRGEWFCRECRSARVAIQSHRTYSDDVLRPAEGTLFTPTLSSSSHPVAAEQSLRDEAFLSESARKPWGFQPTDSGGKGFWERVSRDLSNTASQPEEIDAQVGEGADIGYQPFELDQMAGDEQQQDFYVQRQHQQMLSNIDKKMLKIDYATLFPQALQHRAPDTAVRCVLAASHAGDSDFIRSIDCEQFVAIINTVRLADFTTGLISVHAELSTHRQQLMNMAPVPNVVYQLSNLLRQIVRIREATGMRTEFEVYKALLAAASDFGMRNWASQLWKDLEKDDYSADLECHNLYIAAIIDNRKHSPLSRENKRVIALHMEARQHEVPIAKFSDYSVGPGGVKDIVMTVFGQLLKRDLRPNEESFCHLITAAAREGDMTTVRSLIRKAFGIDVDAVMQGEAAISQNDRETDPADGHLTPSNRLLFTIAHAYGINNDIPKALHLVDFFAQRFNLSIDMPVWNELFEWTFVLATRRTGETNRQRGALEGTLPLESVSSLWETLTRAPYEIEPEMPMYDLLIRNLAQRDHPRAILKKLWEAKNLLKNSRLRTRKKLATLIEALDKQSKSSERGSSGRRAQSEQHCQLELLRREWELADIVRSRDRGYFAKWLGLLLRATRGLARVDQQGDWTLCELPSLLWDWRFHIGSRVEYETRGGILSFDLYNEGDREKNREKEVKKRRFMTDRLKEVPLVLGEDWAGRVPSLQNVSELAAYRPVLVAQPGHQGRSEGFP